MAELTKEEIINYIRNLHPKYEENIFYVENVVYHTLDFLEKKGFIRLEKTKGKKPKKEKVEVFT